MHARRRQSALAFLDDSDEEYNNTPSTRSAGKDPVVVVRQLAPTEPPDVANTVTLEAPVKLLYDLPGARVTELSGGRVAKFTRSTVGVFGEDVEVEQGNSSIVVHSPQQWVEDAKKRLDAINTQSESTIPAIQTTTRIQKFIQASVPPLDSLLSTFTTLRKERLLVLAENHGVFARKPRWKFEPSTKALGSASAAQQSDVQKLVKERAKLEGKGILFRGNPSRDVLSGFLRAHVQAGGNLESVNALLSLGASVNVLVQSADKMFKQKVVEQRSDVLVIAVKTGQSDCVRLLVEKADERSLDEALPFALNQNDLTIIGYLLSKGADASTADSKMLTAVGDRRIEVVELLLTAPKRPSTACIHESSIKAVLGGDLQTCCLLFQGGADPAFREAEALKSAITMERPDLVIAICSGQAKLSTQILDKLVGYAWALRNVEQRIKCVMIEILICAGAQGEISSRSLLAACEMQDWHIAIMMASHGISTNFRGGAALIIAIESSHEGLLNQLLDSKPVAATLDSVIQRTKSKLTESTIESYTCIQGLISAGPSPHGLASLLHYRLQTAVEGFAAAQRVLPSLPEDLVLVNVLAEGVAADPGPDVADLVGIAVTGPLDILEALLSHDFLPSIIDKAFPVIATMHCDEDHRKRVMQICLDAGARGQCLNERLIEYARAQVDAVELSRIILKNASVDYRDGLALRIAIEQSNFKLLELLLTVRPKEDTMKLLWAQTLGAADDETRQQLILRLFHADPRQVVIEDLFVMMIRQAMGASSQYIGTCQLLLEQKLPRVVVDIAFDAAISSLSWMSSKSLPVIQLLLAHGAQGVAVELALQEAASLSQLDAVNLLCGSITNNIALTSAFEEVIFSEGNNLIASIDVIETLIQYQPSEESLSMALVQALDELEQGVVNRSLIDLLLYSGANVNLNDGLALCTAAFYGNAELTRKMLAFGPTKESVYRSFYEALQAGHSVEVMLDLLEAYASCPGNLLDVNFHIDDFEPAIFMSLMMFPTSVRIVKAMIKLEANLEAQLETYLYEEWREDMQTTPEMANVLTWAITQRGEESISDNVIRTIILAGAKVDRTTPKTASTALMLAASMQRSVIVHSLLFENKTRYTQFYPSFKNSFGDSALCYASHIGNIEIVKTLIKAGAQTDDGSLHEAVREMRPDIVKVLLEAGHSADHTSSRHGGRTPLGELCLLGDASVKRDSERLNKLEGVLNLLASQGKKFDPYKTWRDGKNMIFVALDNIIDPVGILDKLIERVFNKIVRDDANLVQVGDYFYSPLAYIQHGILEAPQEIWQDLETLLRNHSAPNRYFAKMGCQQPQEDDVGGGAVGLPADIVRFEEKRQRELKKLEAFEREYQQNQDLMLQKLEHKQALEDQKADHHAQGLKRQVQAMLVTSETKLQIELREKEQTAFLAQQEAEAKRVEARRLHQQKMEQLTQTQRSKLAFDHKKIENLQTTNKLKAAANRDAVRTVNQKNKSNLSFKQASSKLSAKDHKKRMDEIKSKGKLDRTNNKLKLQQLRAKNGETSGMMKAVKVAGTVARVGMAVHTLGASELAIGGVAKVF